MLEMLVPIRNHYLEEDGGSRQHSQGQGTSSRSPRDPLRFLGETHRILDEGYCLFLLEELLFAVGSSYCSVRTGHNAENKKLHRPKWISLSLYYCITLS